MKKLLLLLFLIPNLGFSNPSKPGSSIAGWFYINEDAVKGDEIYIKADSIKKNDSFVYAWVMKNYKKPNEYGYLSHKAYYQMSCEIPMKQKMLSLRLFKGTMGEGDVKRMPTKLLEEKGWQYTEPGTISRSMVDMACAVAYNDPSRLK